jgi:hypothetical protein
MSNAIEEREIYRSSPCESEESQQAESGRPLKQIPIKVIPLIRMIRGTAKSANTGESQSGALEQRQPATRLQQLKWASARLLFISYIGFALASVVGGFLTAPVMTQLFFGDWRFWRHWRRGWRLFPHGWKLLWVLLRTEAQFMFSVPLTSPPQTAPDRDLVKLSPSWSHGTTCGSCRQCCHVMELRCPILDQASGFCSGYNSFYWRYFNCGRYPSRQVEIDYYGCNKWLMQERELPDLSPAFESNP